MLLLQCTAGRLLALLHAADAVTPPAVSARRGGEKERKREKGGEGQRDRERKRMGGEGGGEGGVVLLHGWRGCVVARRSEVIEMSYIASGWWSWWSWWSFGALCAY
jgi:hypothetical protein